MSLRAETAMNIIAALPESELKRLKAMWSGVKEEKPTKKKPLITDSIATEYLLNLYNKNR